MEEQLLRVKYKHVDFWKVCSRWDGINWSGKCFYKGDIYSFHTSVTNLEDEDAEWELECILTFVRTPLITKLKRWWKALRQ